MSVRPGLGSTKPHLMRLNGQWFCLWRNARGHGSTPRAAWVDMELRRLKR